MNTVAVVSACFFGRRKTKSAVFFFGVQLMAAKRLRALDYCKYGNIQGKGETRKRTNTN